MHNIGTDEVVVTSGLYSNILQPDKRFNCSLESSGAFGIRYV